ncbi:hypothetical protein [Amycolatopsis sp. Poz14]|uniref:hypothetical protein n=1 Tax=Amycolatopsis sp. Poz14 TaxID=1447705 RepID=UPI001EE8224D|nr:hypothetical protein [Amycolatopsis sp. Poz14]MCG3753895.1 hypothetical protein [Amycolatopsis sp. Poz14]
MLVEDGRSCEGLAGRPWRVAFALQDEGWLLRNALVVESASGIGGTVLFCVKQARYFFDMETVRVLPGSARGDVVLPDEPGLADRVVLAACPDGGIVLDLTDTTEFEIAGHRWGRKVIRIPSALTAA